MRISSLISNNKFILISILHWMLHNFDDEHCLMILRNCYKALPNDGKVLVINSTLLEVLENTEASRESSILDAILLIQIPQGKDRTKKEYTHWLLELDLRVSTLNVTFVIYTLWSLWNSTNRSLHLLSMEFFLLSFGVGRFSFRVTFFFVLCGQWAALMELLFFFSIM